MPERRPPNRSTESVDNYLKAILTLGERQPGRVASNALATHLGVAPASVTNMLQKLAAASEPLVDYERHRGVLLSPTGRRRALEVVRHHRLIETFLYEVLDYPIDELHEEAERLEHFISERFEERIAAKLGHPTIDPHGHSIPTLEGEMPEQRSMLLADVGEGSFVVDCISDRDGPTLRTLKANGMTPGAKLRVLKIFAGFYSVRIGRSTKTLEIAREIAREVRILPVTQ
jgi:DtxR family Mn-dependent transcriptional regulator